jgi:hypothetical protein
LVAHWFFCISGISAYGGVGLTTSFCLLGLSALCGIEGESHHDKTRLL